MSPTPISPNTIRIALQYILPPSQLDQPLPPYLLSKSLLQRHHFLNISPEDPCEYLCWPSSLDGSKAIDLLELTKPLDDDTPLECPIQYSSDDEYTYAHAHLVSADEPGVRLVFQWDEFDGWKYHDAKLMPFPPQSYPSLVHVTSPSSLPTAYAPPQSSQKDIYGLATNHGSSDDDDYWNAYGAQDIDLSPTGQHLSLSHRESGGDSEDAYWARYSSVHGTADSTRPSPLPLHRRKAHYLDQLPADPNSLLPLPMVVHNPSQDILNEPILIPPTSIIRPSTHSRWDPASPEALSRLLSTISPRGSRSPSPEPSFDNDTELDSLSPPTDGSSGTDYSEVRSPPALGLLGDTVASESNRAEPHEPLTATLSALDIDVSLGVGMSMDSVNGDVGKNEDDYALKEGLRGLYNLWKVVRGSKGVSAKESDKDAFLRIVEEVVA